MKNNVRHKVWSPTWLALAGLFLLLVFATAKPAARILTPFVAPPTTEQTLSELLSTSAISNLPGEATQFVAVRAFYAARDFHPAWTGGDAQTAQAELVLDAMGHAAEDGLDPTEYRPDGLQAPPPGAPASDRVHFELLLTDGVLRYAHDLYAGRLAPTQVDSDIALPVPAFDAVGGLGAALSGGTLGRWLDQLAPPHPEYARLKAALLFYRKIANKGGWKDLPPNGDPQHAALIARLSIEDAVLSSQPKTSDEDLLAALTRYQSRNGLERDGKLGPKTLATLNVPVAERIGQIEANMERWRWMPREFEARYLAVNTADATLTVLDKGKPVLHSRVIVGAAGKRSPILRALVTEVTVNPPWNVPMSIAVKEILPKLRRDPTYLQSQHMVLTNGAKDDPYGLSVDWRHLSAKAFSYRIQQRPGPSNSLGVVKLEMPNVFDVYLHDTPGRAAFAADERALSHGCIRVQEILPLASLALNRDAATAIPELASAIATGETKHFVLPVQIPVYVLYWTVMPNEDGSTGFRPDVDGRDRRWLAAIEPKRVAAARELAAGGCELSEG